MYNTYMYLGDSEGNGYNDVRPTPRPPVHNDRARPGSCVVAIDRFDCNVKEYTEHTVCGFCCGIKKTK
jgi:hypothetical protein